MLTISKALNAGQAQTYHASEFTAAEQNYWKQGDSVPGQWHGRMAESFGLADAVDAGHFARLASGQHPGTGEQLIRHRDGTAYTTADGSVVRPVEHRAGWDATFSAPKSVSLTALVGGDERVREAHRHAVIMALTELERFVHARMGVNHAPELTGKFVAAAFEHDTARPVDGYAAPQLHTHAVIFNMTQRSDGNIRALQERAVFDSQQFATAVYQSALTYELRNLGYEIQAGRSGAPDIKGYTAEYLEASSPRSQQIRQYMEATGFQGAEAAQIAAHSTRDRKEIHAPGKVVEAHLRMAAQYGNQARQVVAEARERALTQPVQRDPDVSRRASDAVTYAKERAFEREAVSDERLLMRDALRRGMGDLLYPEIRANFECRAAAGEFQQIEAQKHASGRQYTTPETIAMERAAIAKLWAGQEQMSPILPRVAADDYAASQGRLNYGQRLAVAEVLASPDRVHGLQGTAGTGKTTTLAAIREAAERQGYAVEGFAPASKAAQQLREAGISADTLQGFLVRGGQDRAAGDPASRHLYMLDESSLASTRQMRDFLDKLGLQDRVLVIGDVRQHQGVEAGKPFQQMQDAGMRTSQLDVIVRQQNPGLLRVVEHLSRNETAAGIDMLQKQGRITQIPETQARYAAIAREFAASPHNTIVVSPDNTSRREINRAVRAELQNRGLVARESHTLPTLIPRNDLTGADRRWAARYNVGEVIHYTRGSKELGVEKGTYGTVARIEPDQNRLTVTRNDGVAVTYDPKRLQGVSVYQEIHRDFAKGDRIQFTAPVRELGVANRELGTIEKIVDGRVKVCLDGAPSRSVVFQAQDMRHFDHGYAMTSHSAQGITTDRVLINVDAKSSADLVGTRFAYVAVSRASQDAQVFTNDAADVGQRLSREASNSSAVEFGRPAVPEKHTDLAISL